MSKRFRGSERAKPVGRHRRSVATIRISNSREQAALSDLRPSATAALVFRTSLRPTAFTPVARTHPRTQSQQPPRPSTAGSPLCRRHDADLHMSRHLQHSTSRRVARNDGYFNLTKSFHTPNIFLRLISRPIRNVGFVPDRNPPWYLVAPTKHARATPPACAGWHHPGTPKRGSNNWGQVALSAPRASRPLYAIAMMQTHTGRANPSRQHQVE